MWSPVTFVIGVVIFLPSSYEATQHENVAKNCRDLQCRGINETGIYLIKPEFTPRPFLVHCDMDTEGSGWAVFFNRADDRQSFALPWNDYKYGFGNDSSFWLGLEYLHQLTTDEPNELFMKAIGEDEKTYYAQYDSFGIGSEGEDYRLKLLDGYHGHHADPFSNSSGQKFSTFDRNNEVRDDKNSCVKLNGWGGWWYFDCYSLVLTSRYQNNDSRLMLWTTVSNSERWVRMNLENAKMMVRPKKKCEKNLKEDNTDKKYEKNNTVKNDPEKGYLEANTKSTENSIVPITLPSVDDSLQWEGYVVKGGRSNDDELEAYVCPVAFLTKSLAVTGDSCGGQVGQTWFKVVDGTPKTFEKSHTWHKGDLIFYEINKDVPLDLTSEDKLKPTSDDDLVIRFIGWNSKSKKKYLKSFRFNNANECSATNNFKSCLVVHANNITFSVVEENAIMVGSEAQLLGVYFKATCGETFCNVTYRDTTRHKKQIHDQLKEWNLSL